METKHLIDVVIPWVDDRDPNWRAQKAQYSGIKSEDNSDARYRDWDNLQYLFRGIEKFWPWVNKVYFITCGQKPEWLNVQCEKLRLVNHTDYIPAEFLPTFNSNTIEMNLHRINDLSEHFIYLNDDFFPIRPLKPTDFFVDGLPCDSAEQSTLLSIWTPNDTTIQYIDFTNLGLINAHFRKHTTTQHHRLKWFGTYLGLHGIIQALLKANQRFFTGFTMHHSAQSFLKSSFKKVWDTYPNYLYTQSQNKFRQKTDVNQWLVRYWQLAENNFHPYSMKHRRLFNVDINNIDEIAEAIRRQYYDVITVNDNPNISPSDFEHAKSTINSAFETILPNKSSFEI